VAVEELTMSSPKEPRVAIESLRPHWDRYVDEGRVRVSSHPTIARTMNESHQRQSLSLKTCDALLVAVGEPWLLHELYLVDDVGDPITRRRRNRRRRVKQPEYEDVIGEYAHKRAQRGVAALASAG
jgi:hypothetical protein